MLHIVSYLGFCSATIALLVFLNATQAFLLSQVFGLEQNGSASGALALVDEIVSIVAAPFWGALSDKIGTRYVSLSGLFLMAAGLFTYPRAKSVYPGALSLRAVFSLGASACVAMITASLAELSLLASWSTSESRGSVSESNSVFGEEDQGDAPNDADEVYSSNNMDGDATVPLFEPPATDEVFDAVLAAPRPNGKLAGMTGFASGIGAIFAVAVLLPLPTKLGDGNGARGIIDAYSWVAIGTLVVAVVFFLTLYQSPSRGLRSLLKGTQNVSIFDEAGVDAGGSVMSYFELLSDGFMAARGDHRLKVAYFGSLVARSASVVLALFVPLWVNQWYYDTGRCQLNDPNGCHAAITQAAILTGIANTVMLFAAPAVGWAGDRYGSVAVLGLSSVLGLASMIGFILINEITGIVPILVGCLMGVAQIGLITTSMSMTTDKQRVASGSVAGVYSLCGSVGILLVTQIGGPLADTYIKSPFVVMAILFAILIVLSQRLASRTTLRSIRSIL